MVTGLCRRPGAPLSKLTSGAMPALPRSLQRLAQEDILTKNGRGLIAAPMINAVTIVIARRRRNCAVWADVCI